MGFLKRAKETNENPVSNILSFFTFLSIKLNTLQKFNYAITNLIPKQSHTTRKSNIPTLIPCKRRQKKGKKKKKHGTRVKVMKPNYLPWRGL